MKAVASPSATRRLPRPVMVGSVREGLDAVDAIYRAHAVARWDELRSGNFNESNKKKNEPVLSLLHQVQAVSVAAAAACREGIFVRSERVMETLPDLLPYLSQLLRPSSSSPRLGQRPMNTAISSIENGERLMREFSSWLQQRRNAGLPTPRGDDAGDEDAARCSAADDVSGRLEGGGPAVMPFVDLWRAAHTFADHRNGVLVDSGAFQLHPLPSAYCPRSRLTQNALTEVLRWLQSEQHDSRCQQAAVPDGDDEGKKKRLWRHSIVSALDAGCGGGMMVDLLLKAKLRLVMAVDEHPNAVECAVATAASHFAAKRSPEVPPPTASVKVQLLSSLAASFERIGGVVPATRFVAAVSPSIVPQAPPSTSTAGSRDDDSSLQGALRAAEAACDLVTDHNGRFRAVNPNEGAARRRRKQFRLDTSRTSAAAAPSRGVVNHRSNNRVGEEGAPGGPWLSLIRDLLPPQLVVYHPATPFLDPQTAIATPLTLPVTAGHEYVAQEMLLAQTLHIWGAAAAARQQPLYVSAVLPLGPSAAHGQVGRSRPLAGVVRGDGDSPIVTPSPHHPRQETPQGEAAERRHVAAAAAATEGHAFERLLAAGGTYRVLHRRRFSRSPVDAESAAAEALGTTPGGMGYTAATVAGRLVALLLSRQGSDKDQQAAFRRVYTELTDFFRSTSLETVVMQHCEGRETNGEGQASRRATKTRHRGDAVVSSYEDTFEYDNYLPSKSSAVPLPDHWTSAGGPSFSYLQDEFTDHAPRGSAGPAVPYFASSAERMLAARRRATASALGTASEASGHHAPLQQYDHNAHASFSAVFSAEAKAQRRGKMRKMALRPTSQRDWFLDERLVQSQAAQVSLANELSRLDVREPD